MAYTTTVEDVSYSQLDTRVSYFRNNGYTVEVVKMNTTCKLIAYKVAVEILIDGPDTLKMYAGAQGVAISAGESSQTFSGGTGGYTINEITGTYPENLEVAIDAENAPEFWSLRLAGYELLRSEKGDYSFTVKGVDSLGNHWEKSFTLTVYACFETATELSGSNIVPGSQEIDIVVSGMTNPIPIDGIYGSAMNITCDTGNLQISVIDPGNSYQVDLSYGAPDVDGSNFILTKFIQGNATPLSSGTAPYTGEFNPGWIGDNGYNEFAAVNANPNGTWKILINNLAGVNYTFGGFALLFK